MTPEQIAFGKKNEPEKRPAVEETATVPLGSPATALPDAGLKMLALFSELSGDIKRLVDHFAPPPASIVGTDYVAKRLNRHKNHVAAMAREGTIPRRCIVEGTGWGVGPYGFHRDLIDQWIKDRVPSSRPPHDE